MNTGPAVPRRTRKSRHCTHVTAGGGRCRAIPVSGSLCAVHAQAEAARREAEDIATALIAGLDEFTSAEHINKFLSRLLLLLAQDRITANLLLRSVTVMKQHAEEEPVEIEYVMNIPSPSYDSPDAAAQNAAS